MSWVSNLGAKVAAGAIWVVSFTILVALIIPLYLMFRDAGKFDWDILGSKMHIGLGWQDALLIGAVFFITVSILTILVVAAIRARSEHN